MKQRKSLVIFGLIVAIIPILGIPQGWKNIGVSFFGALIVIIASTLTSRTGAHYPVKEEINPESAIDETVNPATVHLSSRKK